jgi:hypothetical protein
MVMLWRSIEKLWMVMLRRSVENLWMVMLPVIFLCSIIFGWSCSLKEHSTSVHKKTSQICLNLDAYRYYLAYKNIQI